jgi:IrrE N-terminal-like domain
VTWVFDELDELALALLRRAGIDTHPVPVEQLALRLGADRVITERLEREEGRLELRGSEVVVVTSRDASAARRRFTIAHEVGHLVAADPRYDLRRLRERSGLRDEERFCDRLAESLLMPSQWVRDGFSGAPPRLATIAEFSRAFSVSAAAANLRLARCTNWSQALLRFTRHRSSWALDAVTGWRPERRNSVRRSAWSGPVLSRFAKPGTLSRLWLPLACGEREWLFGAELIGHDGWVLALVDPRRRRRFSPAQRRYLPGAERNLDTLKLFYSLDDIDACIIPASTSMEGKDGEGCEHQRGFAGQPLAA